MTLALVALLSTPLLADSKSWVSGSDQLIAQANDASWSSVSNSGQLIVQNNDTNEVLIVKCEKNGRLNLQRTQE